jgi:porphyrinogen peroxidase
VNFVSGFRPELWREVAPNDMPAGLTGFNQPVLGVDGYSMPATQHDLWLWMAGASNDVVFDLVADCIGALAPVATVADEERSWPYHQDRDLTGFIDGTANPSVTAAPDAALVPDGSRGAGGSVLLFQKWRHDIEAWSALSIEEQERVMGRTKADSVEFDEDVRDPASHVARTDQEMGGEDLEIFRRNTPYGVVTDHGTMFVGFSRDQARLARMLARMAGAEDSVRDALTLYTTALTGAYYWVPPVEALRRFSTDED